MWLASGSNRYGACASLLATQLQCDIIPVIRQYRKWWPISGLPTILKLMAISPFIGTSECTIDRTPSRNTGPDGVEVFLRLCLRRSHSDSELSDRRHYSTRHQF